MASLDRFQIVLLPRREVLASGLSLAEAVAYVRGYHEVVERGRQEAVIAVASRAVRNGHRKPACRAAGQAEEPSAMLHSA